MGDPMRWWTWKTEGSPSTMAVPMGQEILRELLEDYEDHGVQMLSRGAERMSDKDVMEEVGTLVRGWTPDECWLRNMMWDVLWGAHERRLEMEAAADMENEENAEEAMVYVEEGGLVDGSQVEGGGHVPLDVLMNEGEVVQVGSAELPMVYDREKDVEVAHSDAWCEDVLHHKGPGKPEEVDDEETKVSEGEQEVEVKLVGEDGVAERIQAWRDAETSAAEEEANGNVKGAVAVETPPPSAAVLVEPESAVVEL